MFSQNMRYSLLAGLLLLGSVQSDAQNTPELSQTAATGTATAISLPPAFSGDSGLNYSRSYSPRMAVTNPAELNKNAAPALAAVATTYKDGFGRTMESVLHNTRASGGGSIVSPVDNRSRRGSETYLPYFRSDAFGFRGNAFQEQRSYYNSQYPNEGGVSYSMGRNTSSVTERSSTGYLPGKSQAGQGRGLKVSSIANDAYSGTATPATVRIWSLDGSGNPQSTGWYGANQLFGELSEQSDGGKAWAFTDKDGRLVCKTQWLQGSGSGALYGTTYYVYDKRGRLRYTLPPKATALYTGSGTLDNQLRDNLCFQYRYDNKGRLVARRFPGEDGFTEIVYDQRDRAVMRRSPLEARRGQWEITFYDVLNRVKATSLYEDDADRDSWQARLDASGSVTNTNMPEYYLSNTEGWAVYPAENAISGNTMMSYNYYDGYSTGDPTGSRYNDMVSLLGFGEFQSSNGSETPERGKNTLGLPTFSRLRILPSPSADVSVTGDWRENLLYYDKKGRVIYGIIEDFYQGSLIHYDYSGNQYNFSGQLLVSKHKLKNSQAAGSAVNVHTELLQNEYELNTGRLQRTSHKVDDGAWKVLAAYSYDELGRVARKSIGNGGEVQDMSYNIRGSLSGINGIYAETGNKQGLSRTFGESLKYDYGFSQPRYDGKIAGMVWRGAGGSRARANAYGYSYDAAGRLKAADYRRLDAVLPSPVWSKLFADFTVSDLNYDVNGNIKSMTQRGLASAGIYTMDQLEYVYQDDDRSNRLKSVTDQQTADYGLGDFNDHGNTDIDYDYDDAGNLTRDNNKGIGEVVYTHFNKPSVITMNSGSIEYSYDASGSKVQELITDNGNTKRTDYIGNAVYQGDTLKYLQTQEGRTVYHPEHTIAFREEFFVKDHLGNVRSTIDVMNYDVQEYIATYEVASAGLEGLLFGQMDEVRDNNPSSVDPYDLKSGRLNGMEPDRRIGSSLLLKVMAGDKIAMNVNSFYDGFDFGSDEPVSTVEMLSAITGTLTSGAGGITGGEHNVDLVDDMFNSTNFGAFESIVLNNATDQGRPKAYLNYLLFNENMELVQDFAGAFQADGHGSWAQIGTGVPLEIPQNGYLAVYLSNRARNFDCYSCGNVFFDQLTISLSKGVLKEENHYYPHGLPITALSSQAEGLQEQRRKYQGNEYIKDLGLNWMDFQARQYDPQIGRFLGVDPLANNGGQSKWSPYAAMGNAPESMIDPNGEYAYVSNYFSSKEEAHSTLSMMFGMGNFTIDDDGKITITNPSAAKRHFDSFIASGAGGASGGAAALFKNVGDAILQHHKDPSMDVSFNVVYNTVGEMSWHMSLQDVNINGWDGTYNVVQAARRGIGRNDYARQRADWASNMVMGWLAIGASPIVMIVGAEAAAVLPTLGMRAINSYLSNPAIWNDAIGSGILGSAGYAGELPLSGAVGAATRAEALVVEEAVEVAAKTGANLTKAQLKSISSLENQIAKHQTKLAEYIKDPMKFDNMGFLKNAPNDAVRQKIIQSRINHLKQEIQTFQNNIQKILNGN